MDRINQEIVQPNKNTVLASLPAEDYARMASHLRPIALQLGSVLYHPGQLIEYVYFPIDALVSILTVMENGTTVEAGVIGCEGMVGLPVVLGVNVSTHLTMVQCAGNALRLSVTELRREIRQHGPLLDLLLLFTQMLFNQVSQTAACNRLHNVEQRLARWLLLVHDRTGRDGFSLTQEFIARMLGTRRAGVTIAAIGLQDAGLISYSRGHIVVRNRIGLEKSSCECYRLVRNALAELSSFYKK